MAGRKPEGMWMATDVAEPKWPRITDEDAEHTTTPRQVANGAVCLIVDADRDEPLECGGRMFVEHAERGEASAGQLLGCLDDLVENHLKLEFRYERPSDIEQFGKTLFPGRAG
jgi:hypothetical protein